LRTFDAAARHQSLAKASQELNLTDSAVSHQLRRLEAALGVDLFEKAGRGVARRMLGASSPAPSRRRCDIARTAHSLADAAGRWTPHHRLPADVREQMAGEEHCGLLLRPTRYRMSNPARG
jgi:DNA-binding transcriptional ArsR family regulator